MFYPKAGWLTFTNSSYPLVFIPHPKFPKETYPTTLSVSLGPQMKKQVKIEEGNSDPNSPRFMPARLVETEDGQFKAGPFVAILTSSNTKNGFRGNRANFFDIIQMGKKLGVMVYVLTPEGYRPNSSTVLGWVLDTRKREHRWVRATMPTPDVVYNRIPHRKYEQQSAEQELIQKLVSSTSTKLFNPGFFDKWSLFLYIERSPQLKEKLPETHKWGDVQTFQEMLKKYPILFLKPVDGLAGNGMIQIKRGEQSCQVIHQSLDGVQQQNFTRLKDVVQILSRLTHNKKYILQQGIDLAQYEGRPFDLRLLMQKDQLGRWTKTGLGIRVAGKKAISTHVPMGGYVANAHQVLSSLFGSKTPEIMNEIEQMGIDMATHIEKEKAHILGEMSMDIGLEFNSPENSRLWFFEANAKPMKFDEPDIRELSLKRILHFSLYLSGFTTENKEGSNHDADYLHYA